MILAMIFGCTLVICEVFEPKAHVHSVIITPKITKGTKMTQPCKITTPLRKIHSQERAWSLGLNASVTMLAAVILPIFIFAILSLAYLLEINSMGVAIKGASYSAAKKATEDIVKYEMFFSGSLENKIVDLIGSERINRSIISGGARGISTSNSRYFSESEELEVVVEYTIKLPIETFGILQIDKVIDFRIKPWTGYMYLEADSDDIIVYITETGRVYHENYSCTYLKLSIQFVAKELVSDLRNESGGKYKACEKCVYGSSMAGVYITNTGGKYHNSLTCSGLKRTIKAVRKSTVDGMGGCSRCT